METPSVRFDDLSAEGPGSFGLLEPEETFVARRVEDVVDVLRRAEDAARSGLWVAGFVGYEAAPAFNPLLTVRPPGLHDPMHDLPLARFEGFRKRIELEEVDPIQLATGDYSVSSWKPDSSPEQYRRDLAVIGRAIMAGEITRLLHTFRLYAAFNGDAAALYRDLVLSQRGPHAASMDFGRFRLVSASPAVFFRRTGNTVVMRPLLASMRRGRWLEEDLDLAQLLRSESSRDYLSRQVVKEVEAELAEIGTVISRGESEDYELERFETLWHLVAEVVAEIEPNTTIVDIFEAIFPPVAVTGVPKIEATGLIAATEDSPRGAYCGAFGYLTPSAGSLVEASFSVAVRTVVIDQEEGVAEFGVGTPITNRSDVVSAYEEARLKAKVLVERRPEFMLFAEVRCEHGRPLYVEDKLKAVAASAEYFGFRFDVEKALSEVSSVAAASGSEMCAVTLLVDREGETRTETAAAPAWHEGPASAEVLSGVLATHAISSDNVYLFHETTYRRVADALVREHPDADVIVICNEREEVCGALRGNVVARIGTTWTTPPVECGSSPTAFRDRLVRSGRVVEGRIRRDEVTSATELGVVDDIHGWRPVALVV